MLLNSYQIVKWRLELVKKKIKDLTIGEIIDACSKNNHCRDCPLRKSDGLPCGTIYEQTNKDTLEQEVEI